MTARHRHRPPNSALHPLLAPPRAKRLIWTVLDVVPAAFWILGALILTAALIIGLLALLGTGPAT
jgi:hypothetical protein